MSTLRAGARPLCLAGARRVRVAAARIPLHFDTDHLAVTRRHNVDAMLLGSGVGYRKDAPPVACQSGHQRGLDVRLCVPFCRQLCRLLWLSFGLRMWRRGAGSGRGSSGLSTAFHGACGWLGRAVGAPLLDLVRRCSPEESSVDPSEEWLSVGELGSVPDVPARPTNVGAHGSIIGFRWSMAPEPRQHLLRRERVQIGSPRTRVAVPTPSATRYRPRA